MFTFWLGDVFLSFQLPKPKAPTKWELFAKKRGWTFFYALILFCAVLYCIKRFMFPILQLCGLN